jgi:Lar family restriction alleviation protein
MSGPELKPCPFCGCKDVRIRSAVGECWVYCLGCKGSGEMQSNEVEAARWWNRRSCAPVYPPCLHWYVSGAMPDADIRVLIRQDDDEYPVVVGSYDGHEWHDTEGLVLPGRVMGWLDLDAAAAVLDGKRGMAVLS